jgi:dTDP-4-amino-4,6-dideoxygalactose transaminase
LIPQADPGANVRAHRGKIDAAIARVLERGRYVLGPEVEAFESEFAAFCGVACGVGVGSGTDALHLALRAAGVGPGDEVITVAHTAVATVAAIEMSGARPVLVDVDPLYYTLDPQRVTAALTRRTRAIVPVHLYGQPADLAPIQDSTRRHGLLLIQDAAQAHGATYRDSPIARWGDIACFSFYPTKNLAALGDGGMVVTDDPQVAERVRLLREYGWRSRYISDIAGQNSRLDELQAAILRVKLPHLQVENTRRLAIARHYTEVLAGCDLVTPAERPDAQHVYHQYVIRSRQRDALREALRAQGIGAAIHYPTPVHTQPAYRHLRMAAGALAVTEALADEILSLPLYPELDDEQVECVASAIRRFALSA